MVTKPWVCTVLNAKARITAVMYFLTPGERSGGLASGAECQVDTGTMVIRS